MSKNTKELIGWSAAALGLLLTFFAAAPDQWKTSLANWNAIFQKSGVYRSALAVGLGSFVFAGWLLLRHQVNVHATRKGWWDKNIASIIRHSERLIVLDSFQGFKHEFWAALSERVADPRPFHLVYLMLRDEDPFLGKCLKLACADSSVTQADRNSLVQLLEDKRRSPHSRNKTLEFLFWEGISPGPLVSWTVDGKETIGLGFWMHVREATDLTPFIVVRRGPMFAALKKHYENIVEQAVSIPVATAPAT